MLFSQRIFSYNFKVFIYSFFALSVIYFILCEEVSLGIYVLIIWGKVYLSIKIVIILVHPNVKTPSALVFIWSNFEHSANRYKEVIGIKLSQRVLDLLWKNNINLFYKCRVSLADLENPEMSLVDPESPEFYMILCPGL